MLALAVRGEHSSRTLAGKDKGGSAHGAPGNLGGAPHSSVLWDLR
jgi:hypothetical protein